MPAPPEIDLCARCGEHAEWALDDGRWYSACCGAAPIPVEQEPDDWPPDSRYNAPDYAHPILPGDVNLAEAEDE